MIFLSGDYCQRNDFSSQPWYVLEHEITKKGNPLVLLEPNDDFEFWADRAGMGRILSKERIFYQGNTLRGMIFLFGRGPCLSSKSQKKGIP